MDVSEMAINNWANLYGTLIHADEFVNNNPKIIYWPITDNQTLANAQYRYY